MATPVGGNEDLPDQGDDQERMEQLEQRVEHLSSALEQSEQGKAEMKAFMIQQAEAMAQVMAFNTTLAAANAASAAPAPAQAEAAIFSSRPDKYKTGIPVKDYRPISEVTKQKIEKECVFQYPHHVGFEVTLTSLCGMLGVMGLMPILLEQRKEPVPTLESPVGFTPAGMRLVPAPTTFIFTSSAMRSPDAPAEREVIEDKIEFVPEDDIGQFRHHILILCAIFNEIFKLTAGVVVDGDPVTTFKNLVTKNRASTSGEVDAILSKLEMHASAIDPRKPYLAEIKPLVGCWQALQVIPGAAVNSEYRKDFLLKIYKKFTNTPYANVALECIHHKYDFLKVNQLLTACCDEMEKSGLIRNVGSPRVPQNVQVNAFAPQQSSGRPQGTPSPGRGGGGGGSGNGGRGNKRYGRGGGGGGGGFTQPPAQYDNRAPPPRPEGSGPQTQGSSPNPRRVDKAQARDATYVTAAMRRLGDARNIPKNSAGEYSKNNRVRLNKLVTEMIDNTISEQLNTASISVSSSPSAGIDGAAGASPATYPVAGPPHPGPFVHQSYPNQYPPGTPFGAHVHYLGAPSPYYHSGLTVPGGQQAYSPYDSYVFPPTGPQPSHGTHHINVLTHGDAESSGWTDQMWICEVAGEQLDFCRRNPLLVNALTLSLEDVLLANLGPGAVLGDKHPGDSWSLMDYNLAIPADSSSPEDMQAMFTNTKVKQWALSEARWLLDRDGAFTLELIQADLEKAQDPCLHEGMSFFAKRVAVARRGLQYCTQAYPEDRQRYRLLQNFALISIIEQLTCDRADHQYETDPQLGLRLCTSLVASYPVTTAMIQRRFADLASFDWSADQWLEQAIGAVIRQVMRTPSYTPIWCSAKSVARDLERLARPARQVEPYRLLGMGELNHGDLTVMRRLDQVRWLFIMMRPDLVWALKARTEEEVRTRRDPCPMITDLCWDQVVNRPDTVATWMVRLLAYLESTSFLDTSAQHFHNPVIKGLFAELLQEWPMLSKMEDKYHRRHDLHGLYGAPSDDANEDGPNERVHHIEVFVGYTPDEIEHMAADAAELLEVAGRCAQDEADDHWVEMGQYELDPLSRECDRVHYGFVPDYDSDGNVIDEEEVRARERAKTPPVIAEDAEAFDEFVRDAGLIRVHSEK